MIYELKNEIQIQYSPIAQILTNRGIPYNEIDKFLNTSPENDLNPMLLKNMREGAQMLIKHISANSPMFLQVDSDCDGFTSAAFFINYLNTIAPYYAQNFINYRLHDDKSHAIRFEDIPDGTKIVIVPDAGSNDYIDHQKCADAGIDVLILDHHKAEYESSNACVINNQLCDYPTKSLSGVGIVYKFCSYLDSLLNADYAKSFLDLVSLGLIADVVDTRDLETQYLIQAGLTNINNPFIKGLISRDGLHFPEGEPVTMHNVAWYIAPLINAASRAGTMDEKKVIFAAMLESKAYDQIPSTKRGEKGKTESVLVQACRVAGSVKNHQDSATMDVMNLAETIIETNNMLDDQALIIPIEGSSKNLNGLVANKLASKYQRPVLILQRHTQEDGEVVYEGSARGYDKSDLKDFRKFLLESNLVLYAQGHENAFGVGVYKKDLDALKEYCNNNLSMGEIKYEVDFIWDSKNVPTNDVLAIASYKHLWGQKVDEPNIALENIRLNANNISFIGRNGKTLRINSEQYSIIKFFCSDEFKESFDELLNSNGYWTANAIVTCDKNEWNGRISPQFKLVDIEIVDKQKWVF